MTTTEKQKKKKTDESKFENSLDDFQMEDYMNSVTATDVMEKAGINDQNHTEDKETVLTSRTPEERMESILGYASRLYATQMWQTN